MCGICGIFATDRSASSGASVAAVERMTDLMARRGPDDRGVWGDDAGAVRFGFRRLSILDLTATGRQPMVTPDARYALVLNGEIYNFRELRADLAAGGATFRSTGDAEVVLHALARWGVDALPRLNGMFALAFYDSVEKRLLLARDPAGIKPLYVLRAEDTWVFASQYDAILSHPASRGLAIDPEALALYLRLAHVPAGYGILSGTEMLEPGTWLEIRADGRERSGTHWAFPEGREPDLHGSEAVDAVDEAIGRAVKRQLVSDVPVGTFLSGGIDSPLVAAHARLAAGAGLPAFTVGTGGDEFDETADATAYARELGVEHMIRTMGPADALAMLDDAVSACGEPFADSSIFPTLFVSKMAGERVKVLLSGDGGDELFWGYVDRFAAPIRRAPQFAQAPWWRTARWAAKKSLGIGHGFPGLRHASVGDWYRADHAPIDGRRLGAMLPDAAGWPEGFDLFDFEGTDSDSAAEWIRKAEFTGYLPGVLLKVDRGSMFHSLEVRVPLLDPEVIAVAARVDWRSCLDIERGIGKIPLRDALRRRVRHQSLAKRGFSIPIAAWLRGPLKSVFEDTVLPRSELAGLQINRSALADYWQGHVSGAADRASGLWILLSLALWEDTHLKPSRAAGAT